jgi:ketosteroid isomerase-like protein
MSQENVDLVLGLQPRHDLDLVRAMRDGLSWAALSAVLAPALAPDFTCVAHGVPDRDGDVWEGIEGLRRAWLEWLSPWEGYRTEVEDAIDLGDSVIVLVRDFARRAGDAHEVAQTSAAVWTVRDQRVTRVEFFSDRDAALKAVGLEE